VSRKVFISYRRESAKYQAQRIMNALREVLPEEHVFMDIDSIPLGHDFRSTLKGWVEQCDIMLALINPGWSDAVEGGGRRRLDNPNDFVRIEVAAALTRNIPVVPILLDRAELPDADKLPADLQDLINRQAEFIEFLTFDHDAARLISKLGLTPRKAAPPNPGPQQEIRVSHEPRTGGKPTGVDRQPIESVRGQTEPPAPLFGRQEGSLPAAGSGRSAVALAVIVACLSLPFSIFVSQVLPGEQWNLVGASYDYEGSQATGGLIAAFAMVGFLAVQYLRGIRDVALAWSWLATVPAIMFATLLLAIAHSWGADPTRCTTVQPICSMAHGWAPHWWRLPRQSSSSWRAGHLRRLLRRSGRD
jgi:hypothetical protein